jgi:hypothetical protein
VTAAKTPRLPLGLLEISIFSTSLVMIGLLIWFLSLTLLGSRNSAQARLILSMGNPSGREENRAVPLQDISAKPRAQAGASAPEAVQKPPETTPSPEKMEMAGAQRRGEEETTPAESPPAQEVVVPGQTPPRALSAAEQETVVPGESLPRAGVPSETGQARPFAASVAGGTVLVNAPDARSGGSVPSGRPSESSAAGYHSEGLRDPMLTPEEVSMIEYRKSLREQTQRSAAVKVKPKVQTVTPVEAVIRKVRVQGILNTPDGIVAIVNDEILKRGDAVFGAKVLRILGDRVQFKYKGAIFEKKLESEY